MRLAQALDLLVAVAPQANLDLVLAVLREDVGTEDAAARADRQPLDVLFLRQIRRDPDRVAAGRSARPPDRQPADFLGRGDVAIEQRRREIADRDVVEAMAGLVGRQKRGDVDIEREQIADRVLILRPRQPPEGRGPAGIRLRGRRAIERRTRAMRTTAS